jgi:hypothetical protein
MPELEKRKAQGVADLSLREATMLLAEPISSEPLDRGNWDQKRFKELSHSEQFEVLDKELSKASRKAMELYDRFGRIGLKPSQSPEDKLREMAPLYNELSYWTDRHVEMVIRELRIFGEILNGNHGALEKCMLENPGKVRELLDQRLRELSETENAEGNESQAPHKFDADQEGDLKEPLFTKIQAAKCRAIAAIPEAIFEQHIETIRKEQQELTIDGMAKLGKKFQKEKI